MKLILSLFMSLIFLSSSSYAQVDSFSIDFTQYVGVWNNKDFDSFNGGRGISMAVDKEIHKMDMRFEGIYRSINWGSSLDVMVALNHEYYQNEKITITGVPALGMGFALFKDKPLFQFSAQYEPQLSFEYKKNHSFDLGLGINYTNCPKYQEYGAIHQVIELPLQIGWTKRIH